MDVPKINISESEDKAKLFTNKQCDENCKRDKCTTQIWAKCFDSNGKYQITKIKG